MNSGALMPGLARRRSRSHGQARRTNHIRSSHRHVWRVADLARANRIRMAIRSNTEDELSWAPYGRSEADPVQRGQRGLADVFARGESRTEWSVAVRSAGQKSVLSARTPRGTSPLTIRGGSGEGWVYRSVDQSSAGPLVPMRAICQPRTPALATLKTGAVPSDGQPVDRPYENHVIERVDWQLATTPHVAGDRAPANAASGDCGSPPLHLRPLTESVGAVCSESNSPPGRPAPNGDRRRPRPALSYLRAASWGSQRRG